ncbi:hypothetical protein BDZ45DRAFT_754923 [Acephala macrosclerotiorum]|nr:hypothetical protein BDZ45DRAFT_754923 [Acephala macrosclerotiorum]
MPKPEMVCERMAHCCSCTSANGQDSEKGIQDFENCPGPARGVLIGIDIGLTCTGVAIYADHNANARNDRPVVIQQWPGTKYYVNKVPTKIAYKAGEIGIDSWGFKCPELENIDRGIAIKDMFKFSLDTGSVRDASNLENVKLWYRDFLDALYTHIIRYLRERLRIDITSTSIDFIFSIPTLWREKDLLVRTFHELVDKAGFGVIGNVIMELTEGEASASHKFQEREAFMVCDARETPLTPSTRRVYRKNSES